MAILRNRRKLAALNKRNLQEHLRSNLAQNTSIPRSKEFYNTQLFEENEDRLPKKLSKEIREIRRTESRTLCAFSQLGGLILNTVVQGHSRSAHKTSQNAHATNQGTNEDDSQSYPHPETRVSQSQNTQKLDPDDGYDSDHTQTSG